MKLMLAVQGEVRGHMTQALAFQQWSRRNDHQVVRVVAGKNPNRSWPDFFTHGFDVPVEPIANPGFSYRSGRRLDLMGIEVAGTSSMGDGTRRTASTWPPRRSSVSTVNPCAVNVLSSTGFT